MTASLLRSPGLFLVFLPILTILWSAWSQFFLWFLPEVSPSPSWMFQACQQQLVSPLCYITFSVLWQGLSICLFFCFLSFPLYGVLELQNPLDDKFFFLFIIKVFRTIVFIFIVISTMFRPICPPAFFRCLSNSGTFTELRTMSFIETTGVACSYSVCHNHVQVLSIPVYYSPVVRIEPATFRWLSS